MRDFHQIGDCFVAQNAPRNPAVIWRGNDIYAFSFLVNTIAPTIATSNKIEVTSNGRR